jgi:tetratricopeptide (TPR) repeat protein
MRTDAEPPGLPQFAEALRALRVRAGKPDFATMCRTTGYGRTVLSQAFNGRGVPTWPVVEALVGMLGGERDEWRARWARMLGSSTVDLPAVPRQLTGALPHFVGRRREMDWLTARSQASTGSNISVIGGMAGVGKTALAVFWARQHAHRFPDGQLYVNLRGFGPAGSPRAPEDVIRSLLESFGVAPNAVPATPADREALYRTTVAAKRLLILLDNALDTEQVRPLLPGSPTCHVLVTSRRVLTGLVARDHAQHLNLDLFTDTETRELLGRFLSPRRLAGEAVDELVRRCAGLPLAVSIAAARATTAPALSLDTLVAELAEHRGLAALSTGDSSDTDLDAVFSWSYRALSAPAARLFSLLGLHPGPRIDTEAAASLAGIPRQEAATLLTELTQANLLDRDTTGRFECHDLLHAYAVRLAGTEPERDQAEHRLLEHYLRTAYAGALVLMPHREPLDLPSPRPGVTTHDFTDGQPLCWFTEERRTLLAVIRRAAELGHHRLCWQLAEACSDFLDRQGHWTDWVTTHTIALASARSLGDRHGQARMHRDLGLAHTRLGHDEDADRHFADAVELFGGLNEHSGQARALVHIAWLHESRKQPQEALACAARARRLFQLVDDEVGQATALDTAAYLHVQLRDHARALSTSQEALRLFQAIGDRYGEASAWDNVGSAHHHFGRHDEAVTCFHHALRLCEDAADRYGTTVILTHLGDTHRHTGNDAAARECWQRALTVLEDLGHLDAHQVRSRLDALNAG